MPPGRVAVLGVLAIGLAACDFPTEAPVFESRFLVPAERTTLRIDELLPASVSSAGSEFTFSIQPASFSQSLGQMCGAPCTLVNGMTVPKLAFADTFAVGITLPADVQQATLANGAVDVTLNHGFGFDPLRPQGGPDGAITIRVRSGGTVIGTLDITDPFPSGTQLTRKVPLTANSVIAAPLTVDIGLVSPAGSNPVTVNTNALFTITAAPSAIRISEAVVKVPASRVDVDQVALDLSDIDDAVAERVQAGALVVELVNPFNAGGALTLHVSGAAVADKQVTVAPCAVATGCTTSQRVEFTQSELRAMLGRQLTLSIGGQLSSSSGFVTVRPGKEIEVDTQLDLVLRLGGDVN